MANKQAAQLVVVDEGSRQVKVCWQDADGKIQTKVIPSNVNDQQEGNDFLGNPHDSNYLIKNNEGTDVNYFVFDFESVLDRVDTNTERYQVSHANRALVHEALRQAGFEGKPVEVVCTLPLSQFFIHNGQGRRDDSRIDEKKKNLMGEIANVNSIPAAKITDCRVAPESISAWFNLLFKDDLTVDAEKYQATSVLIVDIGGTTTDIAMINGKGHPTSRKTEDVGVFNVIDRIRELLPSKIKDVKTINDVQMENLLRTGRFRNQDVQAIIKEAVRPIQTKLVAAMDKFEKDSMSLDYIVLVGGGAALFGQSLSDEYANSGSRANVILPEDAEFYVAKGIMKSELFQLAQKAKTPTEQSTETA
ncbi:ParM/StbA family protein [Endozoicomonas lisbonensis]|uniref:Plasmid segregation protein ParM n=1 Tax=Endozoicomonas lisbonensis TaxID=3120522 RepID=A0ABV2SP47_9GAMM